MSHNITVEGGTSVRLTTAGKYCDRDIIITAEGGKEDLDVVLTEQDELIDELREVLKNKGSGEAEPVIEPLEVTGNGEYAAPAGVDGYSPVTVNVPIPDGYIQPSGTATITENGTHDVSQYASAKVNVPIPDGYIVPAGTATITENGTHDVAEFASVEVNVAGSGGGDELANALVSGYIEGDVTFQSAIVSASTLSNITFSGDVYLPNATEIGGSGFAMAIGNSIFAPNVEIAGSNAFNGSQFKRIELPECHTLLGNNNFYGSSSANQQTLEVLLIPKVTAIPAYGCCHQGKLHTIDVRSVTSVNTQTFRYCNALVVLDFPMLSGILGTYGFANMNGLKALLLRNESLCSLSNTNAFSNSTVKTGTGYIYVPATLVDSYKTATNWSTYASQFRALEDYTVDGTTTGALDETKI